MSDNDDYASLYRAASLGKKDIVRLLLEKFDVFKRTPAEVLAILEHEGRGKIRSINCFDGNSRINFAQEGIDYDYENNKLEKDREKYLSNLNSFKTDEQKIPLITHNIFFTQNNATHKLDNISTRKTIQNIIKLKSNSNWKHYFWTNDINNVPQELQQLVIIRHINELEDSEVYRLVIRKLAEAKIKADLVGASDIARILILEKLGGFYLDNDFEFYNVDKLYEYSKIFNFFAGKEAEEDSSNLQQARLIGNSFLAASPHHPIFKKALQLIVRNFANESNALVPKYITMPCSVASEVAYKAGGPVITTAYFLSANKKTQDIVLPSVWLYNYFYGWFVTKDSPCHRPGMAVEIDSDAIGYDMFCGGWTNNTIIFYPQNLDAYLFEAVYLGYTKIVKYFYELGANLTAINQHYNAFPLYAAAQLGHTDIVDFLVEKMDKKFIDQEHESGATALYTAVENNHPNIVRTLLKYRPKTIIKNIDLSLLAKGKGYEEIYQLFLNHKKGSKCYYREDEAIYKQEGLNFEELNTKYIHDTSYKLAHLNEFKSDTPKIPFITHHIYLSSSDDPKVLDGLAKDISIRNLLKLNEASSAWNHYYWCYNFSLIPPEISNIKGVELRFLSDLRGLELYDQARLLLEQDHNGQAVFPKASDIFRVIIIKKFGGVYLDNDYEFYQAAKFIELMYCFNFIAGKEFNEEVVPHSFIGNAQFSASINHPILGYLVKHIKRNLAYDDAPDYVKYPCNKIFKLIYETGPAALTIAAFKHLNSLNNQDIILPGYYIFNMDLANYLNPNSPCHIANRNLSILNYPNTLGADLMCGVWHNIPGYNDLIDYSREEESCNFIVHEKSPVIARNYVSNLWWITNENNQDIMDDLTARRIINYHNFLNNHAENFHHYIWTNMVTSIPVDLLGIKGVELIDLGERFKLNVTEEKILSLTFLNSKFDVILNERFIFIAVKYPEADALESEIFIEDYIINAPELQLYLDQFDFS